MIRIDEPDVDLVIKFDWAFLQFILGIDKLQGRRNIV